jgi:hypothetical protein
MGKISTSSSTFAGRLEGVVKDGLLVAGIKAVTLTEQVPGTKLVRLIVMADEFEQLSPTERQNLVWRIIEKKFSSEEQMKISVVVALSKKDVGTRLLSEMGFN